MYVFVKCRYGCILQEAQFISDFGGCIGLWVGASAITAVEMIDFAFKCCHFAMWRNKEQARHKEKQRRKRFGEDGDASDDVTVGTSAGVAASAQ